MFTKLLLILSLFFSIMQSSFAIEGFLKEGGGYGVKPIRELIKESEEGLHSEVNLNTWLEQREQQIDIIEIIERYKKALQIRSVVMNLYKTQEEEVNPPYRIKKQVLFIQGLLIINLDYVDGLILTNLAPFSHNQVVEMTPDSQKILGIQIESGYLVIDLLGTHMIKTVLTRIQDGLEFNL